MKFCIPSLPSNDDSGLYVLFVKGQGHKGLFFHIGKGNLWGNSKYLLEHLKGTKAITFVASVNFQTWLQRTTYHNRLPLKYSNFFTYISISLLSIRIGFKRYIPVAVVSKLTADKLRTVVSRKEGLHFLKIQGRNKYKYYLYLHQG